MPEINFFWDPLSDNILQERDETGAVTAEYTAEPGLYGNVISQNRGGVESQFHYDAQGSTLAVTDDDQNVTDTFAYTAFGEVTERTGTTEVPFQYIGQKGYYTDGLTGQIIARSRPYEAVRGRWAASDPTDFGLLAAALVSSQGQPTFVSADATNRYRYALNRPTHDIDPSGLLCYETTIVLNRNRTCDPSLRSWAVAWNVQGEVNGYILQRVSRRFWVMDCENRRYAYSVPCPEFAKQLDIDTTGAPVSLPVPEETVYWELWPVRAGKVYMDAAVTNATNSDTFRVGSTVKSKGSDQVEGFAFFLRTPAPPPDFPPPGGWKIWKEDKNSPAGGLPYTCADNPAAAESIAAGRPTAIRSLRADWCCCGPAAIQSLGVASNASGECRGSAPAPGK